MVVLVGYCTEVYIVLTYKAVKSVVKVSRCKFAVCIVTILDIIPFTERVANSCLEKEVRQSKDAKSRPRFIGRPAKKILRLFHIARVFLRPYIGHRSTLSFAMCGFPTRPTFDTEPTKKTPPDNLGRRVTHSNFRLVNFRYLSAPFRQRPSNYSTSARTLVTGSATSSPILASFTRSTFANFAHQIPIKL